MPVRVQLSDGRVVTVQTDDPQEAARAAHAYQQANPPRQEYGSWRARGVADLVRGAPSQAYRQAYERRRRERAPQGAPGTASRALEDFNRSGPSEVMNQMWRNLGVADEIAGGATYAGQGVENAIRRLRGQQIEIPASEAANAAIDYERDQRERVAREQPIVNTASIAASVPATAGGPVAAARIPALQVGATAAALNSPFALARQEGSLEERLPGAATETAAVGAFGTGLGALANRLSQAPRAGQPSGRTRAQQFEDAGVRPTQAAISGGTPAAMTRMVSENFIAGGPARARLQASLDDTAEAARSLAGRYGQHGQPEQVGEDVQRGVQRWAGDADAPAPAGANTNRPELISTREWSFRAKANAVYDRVFNRITRDEVGHLSGRTGAQASAQNALAVLDDIERSVSAPNVGELVRDQTLTRVATALRQDADAIRFGDLRRLRTWVREARERPGLTQNIDQAGLARLEQALTQDIYESALIIGGETAAQQLRRADQFYRAGQQRIQRALASFDPNRSGGAQAYERIVALAREGGRQNTRQLQALRNTLRPDEWREVAATVIERMGRPRSGNPAALEEGAFSVEQFVSNYAKLTPDGRRILFGGAGSENLAAQLDNLAQVAGYQKVVEAMANRSRSGINVQNAGSFAGLANPGTTIPTLGVLATMAITGEMLTNPAFVRWLASASRSGGGAGGMRQHLAGLASIAARDPAIAPFYAELVQRVGGRSQPQTGRPQRSRELVQ